MKKPIIVAYKENGKFFITNELNFKRVVRNSLEINEVIGFSNLEEISDYFKKYFPQYDLIISKL